MRWTNTQNDLHEKVDGIRYQIHNTHQSHKKGKLREPEASHVIHVTPCEMWIASLTRSIETWLKSAGHNGGMSLNKDPDL